MADNDDTKLDNQDSTEVDEASSQDEADESKRPESSETAVEDDQSDDDASASKSTFEKRFTQFKGDSPEEYIKNLEQGYENSSKEALRLKKQIDAERGEKLSAIANSDAASDKKDEGESQKPQSVTDMWAAQEMKRRHVEQYNVFAGKHPEVNEDDDLFQKLDEETGRYMNYVLATDKRVPDLAEALEFAWMRVGPHDDSSKDEKVASAMKNAGSAAKSKAATKDPAKSQFTDKQIEAAKRINPEFRDKSRTEIEELLSKYVKK